MSGSPSVFLSIAKYHSDTEAAVSEPSLANNLKRWHIGCVFDQRRVANRGCEARVTVLSDMQQACQSSVFGDSTQATTVEQPRCRTAPREWNFVWRQIHSTFQWQCQRNFHHFFLTRSERCFNNSK